MKTNYRVASYRSAEEFEKALNELEPGWALHSFIQGQAMFAIVVYMQVLEVWSPGQQAKA